MTATDLKLKVLAAAVALAVSGPAGAAISAGANGDLFFNLWNTQGTADTADDTSYTLDTGLSLNQFAGAGTNPSILPDAASPSTRYSIGLDSLGLSFVEGVDAANLFWNIAAVDTSGSRRVLTTGKDAPTGFTNLGLTNIAGGVDLYLAQVNGLQTHSSQDPGSSVADPINSPLAVASGSLWGTNFGGKLPGYDNSGSILQSLNFYLLSTNGTNATSAVLGARIEQFAFNPPMQWGFDPTTNSLVYAPVPEPGTWAMLAAGLLALGAVARRRLS
jgi:hypothetical protein